MNRFFLFRILHLFFVGLLVIFIYFTASVYQPIKNHNICAETSAKNVLGLNSQGNSYTLYQVMYKNCISQKGNLATLLGL